jgi:hypothetical protein
VIGAVPAAETDNVFVVPETITALCGCAVIDGAQMRTVIAALSASHDGICVRTQYFVVPAGKR